MNYIIIFIFNDMFYFFENKWMMSNDGIGIKFNCLVNNIIGVVECC